MEGHVLGGCEASRFEIILRFVVVLDDSFVFAERAENT